MVWKDLTKFKFKFLVLIFVDARRIELAVRYVDFVKSDINVKLSSYGCKKMTGGVVFEVGLGGMRLCGRAGLTGSG